MEFRGCRYRVPGGFYFDDEWRIRERYWDVRPGDSVVDVGCGFGSYTMPALACGARVAAIDSNRDTLRILEEVAGINGFTVAPIRAAVFNGAERLPLALKRQHHGTAHSPPRRVHWATIDGLSTTGAFGDRVDWMKVDVEGAELGVLQGAERLLARDHPGLIVEDHSRVYGWVRREGITQGVADLLQNHGYRIELVPYHEDGTASRDYLIGTHG